MAGSSKARKRSEAEKKAEWVEPETGEAVPEPDEADATDADAIGVLLGGSASPVTTRPRFQFDWKQWRWALFLLPVIGVAAPIFLWAHYESNFVTSKNAAVRGHLAEIGTRLSGIVASVECDVGDRVEKGQVLVQLENRHLAAEVQEARADVAGLERKIEVERLTIAHERLQLDQTKAEAQARVDAANAQVSAAQVEADDADRNLELRRSLYSRDGAVSSETLHEAESARRSAQARLEEAQANLAASRSKARQTDLTGDELSIREENIGVLEADLLRAKARLARAEAQLEGSSIRAPGDGAIVRRISQPGGSVEVGQPIISMWLGDDMWVEAWVDEEDIGKVRIGSPVTVTLHSFPGQEFEGVVDKIGLATDLELPDMDVPQPRGSRMSGAPVVGVRIRLLDRPAEMLPGLSAVVAIRKAE